jgi:mannose-6-phosphate isomerase-like protein (cupin superfamily)
MLTAAPGTMETPTLPARSKDEIAVVVPVYMGKAVLRKLCGRLLAALEPITPHFSIVLVDDRSPDDAWPLIQELGREARHRHPHSEQIWLVEHGTATLLLDAEQTAEIGPGDVIRTTPGEVHGVINTGGEPFIYLAVTTPPQDFTSAYSGTKQPGQ